MKKLFVLVVMLFSVVAFLSAQQPTDAEKIVEGEAIVVIGNPVIQIGYIDLSGTNPLTLQHGSILIVKQICDLRKADPQKRFHNRMPWTYDLVLVYNNPKRILPKELLIQANDFLRLRQEFRKVEKNLEQYRKIEEEQRLILKFLK